MRVWIVLVAACSFEHGRLPGTGSDSGIDATGDAPRDGDNARCSALYPTTHGTSRYRVGSGTWYQGEMMCEQEGAHLAVIGDDTENMFVLSLDSDGSLWIGMSDHASEGIHRWVTGGIASLSDPHWQTDQPNDNNGNEDCIEMNAGGIWNDKPCSTSQTFVCECDAIALPTPPTWCQTGTISNCDQCGDACNIGELCQSNQTCQ